MAIPASLRGGPITTNALSSKRYLIFHVIIMWLSALPPFWLFWRFWPQYNNAPVIFFIMLPVFVMLWYLLFVFDSMVLAKFFLIFVNLIHKPREGYFPRSNKNIDYRFWSLRATIKKFALYAAHNFPLPWIDVVAFKLFGVKVGGTTTLFDAWVDVEFIEIGENTILGQGSVVMSTMVTRDWLIIKTVKIGNNVVIGAHSVVSPGTVIGDNTVLGALAGTSVGQELEPNWVYMGVPARKYHKNEYKSMEESDEEMARKRDEFKQYLTIEDIEEVQIKTRKERRAERKFEREQRKIERLEEEKQILEEKIDDLDDQKMKNRDLRRLEKLKDKIESEKEKEEVIEEKISEIKEEIAEIKEAAVEQESEKEIQSEDKLENSSSPENENEKQSNNKEEKSSSSEN